METKKNTKNWTAKKENEKAVNPGAKKVHNLIIVDESGSMNLLYHAALNGMNETLEQIRKNAAECPEQAQEVTLVTFDTSHYSAIFNSTPAGETRQLTNSDYRPGGATPLYDAMGKALTDLQPKVKENEAVIVTVITDGEENASCEYSRADIKALVERLDKEQGWFFSYIGANQDAAKVGQAMGIADTLNFDADEISMQDMWSNYNESRNAFVTCSRDESFNPIEVERGKFFKRKSKSGGNKF